MSFPEEPAELPPELYWAARLEDALQARLNSWLRRRGWQPRVLAYTGYGAAADPGSTDGWARVLGRVVLVPPRTRQDEADGARGWRRFFAATAADIPVAVEIGGRRHVIHSERGGYLDSVLGSDLPAGPGVARLRAEDAESEAALQIVGTGPGVGVVSDIDDTVMVTALPRPLVAFWNTFLRLETSRRAVPGVAELYRRLLADTPDALVVYLSTGAWNVAPAMRAFLARHGFPAGPLLLTDWGPTTQGMFRSGPTHKRDQLARLLSELPQLRWIFVGDDGQLDPDLYAEAVATAAPGQVRAVAIRELRPSEQLRTNGARVLRDPDPPHPEGRRGSATTPEVRAPDGFGLLDRLRAIGIVGDRIRA